MQKIDRNLKILIGIGLISIIGIGVFGINTQLEIGKLTSVASFQVRTKTPIEEKALLIIDDGKASPQRFEMKVDEQTTVFDFLKQTGIALDYTEYDIGIFIEAIGGVQNNKKEKQNWMYYINGESAKQGVGKQVVKPGDKIEFRFEKVSW